MIERRARWVTFSIDIKMNERYAHQSYKLVINHIGAIYVSTHAQFQCDRWSFMNSEALRKLRWKNER